MFDNDAFITWLDKKSGEIVEEMAEGKPVSTENMMVLAIKAQSNRFERLHQDLKQQISVVHQDVLDFRKEINKSVEAYEIRVVA